MVAGVVATCAQSLDAARAAHQTEEQAILLESFGKDARFLLKEDGGQMILNESLVNMLISCRGKYLLSAVLTLMKVPGNDTALVHFGDLTDNQTRHLYNLLSYLCSGDPVNHKTYILEVEMCLALQRRHDGDGEVEAQEVGWSEMWCKILNIVKSDQLKVDMTGEQIANFLPDLKSIKVCPASFLKQKNDKSDKSDKGDKTDDPDGSTSTTKATATRQSPSFEELWGLHDLGESVSQVHAVSILAMRATLEAHFMANALSHSSKDLLKVLQVDPKNAAILQISDVTNALNGAKLFAFGTISTEWAPRSIKVTCS